MLFFKPACSPWVHPRLLLVVGGCSEGATHEGLIEPFPDGAIARRGPHKATFNPELNSEVVFDILTSDGKRIRGGVRAIQLTDLSTGANLLVGTVKESVKAQLLPPNQLVYLDAFDGIQADLLIVWKYNLFSHDVILREQPAIPADWNPDTVRLEVLTEFMVDEEPELRTHVRRPERQPEFEDHVVIHFGKLAMIEGKAFAVEGEDAFLLGDENLDRAGISVQKQWHHTEDGRRFLIESVSWLEALPQMIDLPLAAQAGKKPERQAPPEAIGSSDLRVQTESQDLAQASAESSVSTRLVRQWPQRARPQKEREPIQIASLPYQPQGYIVDFRMLPDDGDTTFKTGETYIIRTDYYIGTTATFETGCVIKRWDNNGASLILYGAISFPDTLQSCVFTSIDDDSFGERFPGTTNPSVPASDGDPSNNTFYTQDALKILYVNYSTEVRSSIFRWANAGIEYWNTGSSANHTIRNCRFENMQYQGLLSAVQVSIDPSRTLTFINSDKCKVDNDVAVSQGTVVGSLASAPFCTEKSFKGMDGSSWEDLGIGYVPDTMGAAGPSHFVELLNQKIAVFSKSTGIH